MKVLVKRLIKDDDLKNSVVSIAVDNDIKAGCILSAVGCVDKATIRLADGKTTMTYENRYEIVSLTGTIADNGVHLHISLADDNGNVIGGHLMEETVVNTTCELIIGDLSDDFIFHREYDENTKYRELTFKTPSGGQ